MTSSAPAADAGNRILVIEDDPAMVQVLEIALRGRGHAVLAVGTGTDGLDAAAATNPDLVLLDLGLPDVDGIEVCRQLRRWFVNPILVLSADGDELRKIAALDEGADDYVTKPFSMPEVLARVRVALRHRRVLSGLVDDEVLELGALRIDAAARAVELDGVDLHLARKEYDLLLLLARNAGKVLTHRTLTTHLWGDEPTDRGESLRWHVMKVRKKLGTGPGRPELATEPGVGYRLTVGD